VVLAPREDEAVMEPRVMKTMSWGSTWMRPVARVLVDARWISETVIVETGEKERVVTSVSVGIVSISTKVDE
jgi:hypothetical protein